MDAGEGRLSSEAEGEIETEGGVLVIKRIHVTYRLRAGDGDRQVIDRVMERHQEACPVYRSLHPQIRITTSLELLDD